MAMLTGSQTTLHLHPYADTKPANLTYREFAGLYMNYNEVEQEEVFTTVLGLASAANFKQMKQEMTRRMMIIFTASWLDIFCLPV